MKIFPRRSESGDVPVLPPSITFESVPGRWGHWTATVETSAGRVTVTSATLHEARDALDREVRNLRRRRDGS